jgi:predicted glycosyltransferase
MEFFRSSTPDSLLVETFLFGRKLSRVELNPLLDMAWNKRAIVSSTRDVLDLKATGPATKISSILYSTLLIWSWSRETPSS